MTRRPDTRNGDERPTLDELFMRAASSIRRYTPDEMHFLDAAVVDIRSQEARERNGAIPRAFPIPRTVLEWRVASREWRNTTLDGRKLVVVCDEGYASVFAAAALVELGRDAGDLKGGFDAWLAARLPITRPRVWDGLPGMGPPD